MKRPDRIRMRGWLAVAVSLFLAGSFACSDSGVVPEPEAPGEPSVPTPDEEPETLALELLPPVLRFDVAGNPLEAEALVIRTNGAWQLELPEGTEWIVPSSRSGVGCDTVRFHLYIDETYHTAEGRVTATGSDGVESRTASFTVEQGTPPAGADPEDPELPEDPDGPGALQPDDPSGDDPADPETPENPENPQDPEPPAGEPSDPENPDDPSGDEPATPPVQPAEPKLVAVDPTLLWWNGTDAPTWKQVTLYVADCPDPEWEVSVGGPQADRFEVQPPERGQLQLRVRNAGRNECDAELTAVLSVTLRGGNTLTIPLTQTPRPAGEPEQPGSGGSDAPGADEPGTDEPAATGGTDDFAALRAESRFMQQVGPTPAGWSAEHCAVYAGGALDSDPVYGSLLGSDSRLRGLAMTGSRRAPGRIVSPELTGGCGTLRFDYGITQRGDERVDFTVEIVQNGQTVRSFPIRTTAEKLKKMSCTLEVQLAGTFRIVWKNNSPSGETLDVDLCTIFNVAWTDWQ